MSVTLEMLKPFELIRLRGTISLKVSPSVPHLNLLPIVSYSSKCIGSQFTWSVLNFVPMNT